MLLSSLYFFPALGIFIVKIPVRPACHCRTAPTPCPQFTFGTLLKLIVFPILLHLAHPYIRQTVLKNIGYLTILHSAAGIDISVG